MKKLIVFLIASIFVSYACVDQNAGKDAKKKNEGKKTEAVKKNDKKQTKENKKKQAKKDEVKEKPLNFPDTLAEFKDGKVKKEEVLKELDKMEKIYRQFGQKLNNEQKKRIAGDILNKILDNKLLFAYAKENNIKADEQKVQKELENFKKSFKKEEDLQKFFKRHDLTEDKLIKTLKDRALKDAVIKKEVTDKIKIDEKDVKKYYEDHKKDFLQQEQVKAKHILIKTPMPLPKNATEEQKKDYQAKEKAAKEKAEKLLAELKKNPKIDFGKFAMEHSEGPSAKKGGELGWFTKRRMVKPFADAAFKLKKGEISGLVKTNFGYHIIKVEDKKEAKQLTYDEVKKRIEDRLKRIKIREETKAFLKMLRTKYLVKIYLK